MRAKNEQKQIALARCHQTSRSTTIASAGLRARARRKKSFAKNLHIIQDWGEDRCLTNLACHEAKRRLLIIEMVLPTGNTPHLGQDARHRQLRSAADRNGQDLSIVNCLRRRDLSLRGLFRLNPR